METLWFIWLFSGVPLANLALWLKDVLLVTVLVLLQFLNLFNSFHQAPLHLHMMFLRGPIEPCIPYSLPKFPKLTILDSISDNTLLVRVHEVDGRPLANFPLEVQASINFNYRVFHVTTNGEGRVEEYINCMSMGTPGFLLEVGGREPYRVNCNTFHLWEAPDRVSNRLPLMNDQVFYLPASRDISRIHYADITIPRQWAAVTVKAVCSGKPVQGAIVRYRRQFQCGGDSEYYGDLQYGTGSRPIDNELRTDELGHTRLDRLIPGMYDLLCFEPSSGGRIVKLGYVLDVPVLMDPTTEVVLALQAMQDPLPVEIQRVQRNAMSEPGQLIDTVWKPEDFPWIMLHPRMDQLRRKPWDGSKFSCWRQLSPCFRFLRKSDNLIYNFEMANSPRSSEGLQCASDVALTLFQNGLQLHKFEIGSTAAGDRLDPNPLHAPLVCRGTSNLYKSLWTCEIFLQERRPGIIHVLADMPDPQKITFPVGIYENNYQSVDQIFNELSRSEVKPEAVIPDFGVRIRPHKTGSKILFIADQKQNPFPPLPDWERDEADYGNVHFIPPVKMTVSWENPSAVSMKKVPMAYVKGRVRLTKKMTGDIRLNIYIPQEPIRGSAHRIKQQVLLSNKVLFNPDDGRFFAGPFTVETLSVVLRKKLSKSRSDLYQGEICLAGGGITDCGEIVLNHDERHHRGSGDDERWLMELEGTLRRPDGKSPFGAQVFLLDARQYERGLIPDAWGLVDPSGHFLLCNGRMTQYRLSSYFDREAVDLLPELAGALPSTTLVASLPGSHGCVFRAIQPDRTEPVELILPPGISCQGSVRVAEWPDFKKATRVSVHAEYQTDNPRVRQLCSLTAGVDARGRYRLGGLTPGTYEVQASLDGIWFSESIRIHVSDQDPQPLNFIIPEPGDRFPVRCISESGEALEGISVRPDLPAGPLTHAIQQWPWPTDHRGIVCLEGMSAGSREIRIGEPAMTMEVKVRPLSSASPYEILEITVPPKFRPIPLQF